MFSFHSVSTLTMKMEATDATEWSEKSYKLEEILKEFSPPLTVFVDEGYMLDESDSLAAGQVITIQSQETLMQFKGLDEENKKVCIPMHCPFKVKMVSQLEGRAFSSIREISDANPPAKFVKVLSKGQKESASINKGDRLKILLSERDSTGPTFLHLRNQNGKHLRLSANFNGKFCECGENDEEYMLEDLVYRELPFFIKFVVSNEKSSVSDLVGIIKITELANETLAFCTSYSNGKRFMAAFPITFDVKVRPAKLSNIDDNNSNELKTDNNRLQKLRESIYIENLVDDSQYVRFLPFEDADSKQNSAISPTELNCTGKMEAVSNQNSPDSATKKDATDSVINRNDPKRKSTGFLSKVKSKLRGGAKSSGNKAKRRRPEIVVLRDSNGACSDGGDSGIYEEIPGDTYVSMDVIDGIRRTLGRNSTTSVKGSIASDTDVPPPLPGNHPIERRHTVCLKTNPREKLDKNVEQKIQRDEENFRKFYESMRKSERELKDFDIEDVGEILKKLKLSKYVKRFKDNKIDGKLLVDLDEAVFKDMQLTPFESRKLRKYAFGWRPDKEGAMASTRNESEDSFNAMLWSENEVEVHLNSLGMNEFAKFCKENQVNGDLLWDIVVDEDMIYELVDGKDQKLKAIKLKNYVIEGWRPKMSKKQSSEDRIVAKVRSKSFNSGKKLTSGDGKNKTARVTSNYECATEKTRSTVSTQVSKDNVKDTEKGSIGTRPRSATNKSSDTRKDTAGYGSRRGQQKSSSLYQRPASASYKPAGNHGKRTQTSSGYEIPVTKPASFRIVNTVSRQAMVGDTNTYEEPVEKSLSSRSKPIVEGKGPFREVRSIPERNAPGTQSSLFRKQTSPKPVLVPQNTKVSKSDRESRQVDVTKRTTGGNRSITPTSSTSSKGECPTVVDFHAEARPKSGLRGKVSYPINSPYGKKVGNTNTRSRENGKGDSRQEIKIGEKIERKQTNDREKQHTSSSKVSSLESKNLARKNQRTAEKKTATDEKKQDVSCKNATSKETKPQVVGSAKQKEIATGGKRNIFDEKEKNEGLCAKVESKIKQPVDKTRTRGVGMILMPDKSKKMEKQKSTQSSKEEKRSYAHRAKNDKKELKNTAFQTDSKSLGRTSKEEERKSNDDTTQHTRLSVAQLKKQFDRV